jgi:hypothetical protein
MAACVVSLVRQMLTGRMVASWCKGSQGMLWKALMTILMAEF